MLQPIRNYNSRFQLCKTGSIAVVRFEQNQINTESCGLSVIVSAIPDDVSVRTRRLIVEQRSDMPAERIEDAETNHSGLLREIIGNDRVIFKSVGVW